MPTHVSTHTSTHLSIHMSGGIAEAEEKKLRAEEAERRKNAAAERVAEIATKRAGIADLLDKGYDLSTALELAHKGEQRA